jgi:uncharacterized tellurite resistance protein B-like protein
MSIWKILGIGAEGAVGNADSAERDTVRKIVDELAHLPLERARYIAMFAFILSRVANADLTISDEETRAMERIVVERGGLPEEQAILVVHMAKTQNLLFGGTDNFSVTREFGKIANHEEKIALLRCLFAVSAADDSISTVESSVIRQITDELGLDHAQFAELRSEFRDQLAVLKPKDSNGGC